MPATAFAAIPSLQVIFFGKNDITFSRSIIIFSLQSRFSKIIIHNAKIYDFSDVFKSILNN
jgi:hypothetical protein